MSLIRFELDPHTVTSENPSGIIFVRPSHVECIAPSKAGPAYAVVTLRSGRWHTVKGSPEAVNERLFGTFPEAVTKEAVRSALQREWCMVFGVDTPHAAGLRYGLLQVATRLGTAFRTDFGPVEAARVAEEAA